MPRPTTTSPDLRRLLASLLVVILALGVGGCEEGFIAPASVTLRYRERAPLTRERLVVTVDDINNEWYFEGVDLPPSADGWLTSRSLRVSTRGGVRITVSLRGTSVVAAAGGEIVLPESPGEEWLVDIFTSEAAPSVACDGCAGLARLAIAEDDRPTARDWLYVRWGSIDVSPPPDTR
ncbi:MAG: hypothetical protein ACYC2G_15275 [Gemmatimonadaceae bacterium]